MDIDSQWSHGMDNFAMDSNDYEKMFESYISDADHDDDFEDHERSSLFKPEQQQHAEEDQQLNEIFIDIPPPVIRLDLCPVCSRKFAPETLMKHVIICEKINTKKRKPFDSSRQRLNGTEFVAVISQSPVTEKRLTPVRTSPPKMFQLQRKSSDTSLKSQPAMSTMNNMSRKNSTISLGGSLRPLAKRSVAKLPEKCPYCERNFGFKAYDRHVEWCKEKSLIKPSTETPTVSAAKERMKTRITYKAPSLRTKRGTTREKYSNGSNTSINSLADFDNHSQFPESMTSSMTSDNGLYDPFLSAKKQLEELFSPSTTPTTQMINSMMTTPSPSNQKNNEDLMSKSLTLANNSRLSKTPQPVPKLQNNFKRTSSLRLPNHKPRPTVFLKEPKSNIHCGIEDDGPISPNFLRATEYDELPIKSPYSAIKQVEQKLAISPAITLTNQHLRMRDKKSAAVRKNLKLDIKNPNLPSADYGLSKTDSLSIFLKYENDTSAKLSEKEIKDKNNSSLSKQSHFQKDNKLPDIEGSKNSVTHSEDDKNLPSSASNSVESFKTISSVVHSPVKSHSAPLKLASACENLPSLTNNRTIRSSPSDQNKDPIVQARKSGGNSLRRQMKYNIENILFDTDPELKSTSCGNNKIISQENYSDKSKSPEKRFGSSNTEEIFEDFDFDQFIASFNDDDQFPIFKDYKTMMAKSPEIKNAEENINNYKSPLQTSPKTMPLKINSVKVPQHRSEAEEKSLKKLDDLCKMLSGHSDSDESNSLDTEASESQGLRSKSSADSAYGSLSRQSQSPEQQRKTSLNMYSLKPIPPLQVRQQLELKKTDISPRFLIDENKNSSDIQQPKVQDTGTLSKFCHECGYKFVVPTAKFCIECGVRRIKMT